jgi:hypothetical protein
MRTLSRRLHYGFHGHHGCHFQGWGWVIQNQSIHGLFVFIAPTFLVSNLTFCLAFLHSGVVLEQLTGGLGVA